ncbi:DUF6264 family protein [Aeromicrobium sp. Root344]|uniref:DUF6264 family protein n=1 Tax=Aeromicrobium sp. Root344 TaxID=1736521 RepID=UPI000A56CAB7|nr:DUF6264 family protein [Aeromicrobium sp. Root344]
MPPEPPLPPFGTPPPQPPPQGFGTPPPHPQAYGPPRPDHSARTVDRALSWVLFVLQLLGTLVLGLVSIFAVFATDSCGSNASSTVPAVCDSDYFGSVLIGYWIALLVLVIATLVAMVVATARATIVWPWTVGGIVLTVVATIVFFVLMGR